MKVCPAKAASAIALAAALAACAPTVVPDVAVPAPVPTMPAPRPTPVEPQVIAASPYANFLDAPQSPGTWTYFDEPGESLGLFGVPGRQPDFMIRCDKTTRKVGLARRTAILGSMRMIVETETATRELTAQSLGDLGLSAVELDPRDPVLDAMAITKGRFAISVPRAEHLYIPAWVEVSRVIEDCR
jgi:hypothetical protein